MSIGTVTTWWRRVRRARRPFGRTRVAAAMVAVVWGMTWLATSHVSAATATVPGQGNAYAETDRIDPKAGSLTIGIIFGETIAGHQNQVAKAQSQAIDLGTIGTSLTGYNCGKPPSFQPNQLPTPLIVETGDPGAAAGVTQSDAGGGATKFGLATAVPYSKAVTSTAPIPIAGVINIGGGTSSSYSGLVNGQRVAGASTDISGITFPGGITLSNLHWDVTFPSTGGQPTGSFSIGHATGAAGAPIPTDNAIQTLTQLNAALGALGFQIDPPTVHLTQGIMYVDPMGISIVPNSTRDGVSNAVLSGIQPITSAGFAAILNAICDFDTPLTVAQIAVGAITGAGSFNVTLGGVQATSGTIAANAFSLGTPAFSPGSSASAGATSAGSAGSGSAAGTAGSSSLVGGGAAGPTSGATPAAGGAPAARQSVALSPIKALQGKRGGALATVGLGGLGLLGLLAEGDRRKMRHAQRTVTFEE